jgi:molybdenum cofactor biosynthesis enzyme MoaA
MTGCPTDCDRVATASARSDEPAGRRDGTSNLHCVYCHNDRSDEIIDADELTEFLQTKVVSVSTFQLGCVMEPTRDKRLADIMLIVAHSPAKPVHDYILQTNGILLHMHDYKKMTEAGLTRLSVSMDAADPQIRKNLRGGMSIQKASATWKASARNVHKSAWSSLRR